MKDYNIGFWLTAWVAALVMSFILAASFHLDDRGYENQQAADLIAAQNAAMNAARMTAILRAQCLRELGEGASVLFDDAGNFSGCTPRGKR